MEQKRKKFSLVYCIFFYYLILCWLNLDLKNEKHLSIKLSELIKAKMTFRFFGSLLSFHSLKFVFIVVIKCYYFSSMNLKKEK